MNSFLNNESVKSKNGLNFRYRQNLSMMGRRAETPSSADLTSYSSTVAHSVAIRSRISFFSFFVMVLLF